MVKIYIKRNKEKEIIEFTVLGHANTDEYGKDIVCAAVSVLSQTIILGLYDVIKIQVPYEIDEGYLTCKIPTNLTQRQREDINILLDTMFMGIKSIKESYDEYIDIHDKEV
ncbi:MAG: ribosomal-processing cysteine protease Prp [Clostridiales bacterium]|nr:ribosomal-processing cysteine protease Prp [Clostridiales bacterium]